jgi:hypothetical protein
MSTRFATTININGVSTDIELIRDGFNIWYPDAKTHYYFEAKYERVFSQSMWAYKDNVLGSEQHQVLFETEGDVTAYMAWRIQRHMSALGIPATDIPPQTEPVASTPDSGAGDAMNDVATLQLKLAQALYALDDTKAQVAELTAERERVMDAIRNARIELFRMRAWDTKPYEFLSAVDAEPINEDTA